MKKRHLYLLTMACAGLLGRANAQCGWQSLGAKDTNQIAFGIAEYNSLVTDSKNNTYVAFYDENYWGAAVREFIGGQWVTVGNKNVICHGKSIWESIAVDNTGKPYMACQNYNKTLHCSVFGFNGTTWDTLGQSSFTNPAQYISLAIDKNGIPYVAYEDLVKADKLDVFSYNSGSMTWSPVGGSLAISPGQAQWVSLAFDTVNNIPYVAFECGDTVRKDKLVVYSFNGTSWVAVGGVVDTNGISADTASNISMTVDKNGHPYISFNDASVGGLTVMTFNGTAWSTVSTASTLTGGPVTSTSIGVDSIDNVYVGYIDGSKYGYGGLSIAEYNGSKWIYAGGSYNISQDISQKGAKYVALAMDHNGLPSVVEEDGGVGDHNELFKWNPTGNYWALQRGLGFSAGSGTGNGTAAYMSIGVSPSNTTYAAYSDGNDANKATVMSFNGTSWSLVGSAGISGGIAKYTNIGFDKAGDPICMFSDYSGSPNKYGITAKVFKSGTWQQVGTNSNTISGANCYYVNMTITSSDTIYAAFQTTNYHMSVMKCAVTGLNWTSVGPADVNGDSASFETIAIDKNNVPYVAFIDNAVNGSGVSVMKYAGGSWQYVGMRNLDSGQAVYPSLAIDPTDNMPVVAYTQYAGSYNAHCKKFDGTNWNYVGAPGGFSEDWTDYMSLIIDKTGDYFVAYQDWGNEQVNLGMRNITVDEFDPKIDTAWRVLPAYTSTSLSGSSYQSLALDGNGNLYIGYSAFSGYVKKLGCPTGINEIEGGNNLSATVYPNPNNGSFTIALQNVKEKTHVSVYNVLGENIYTAQLSSGKTQVNLNSQAPGIYLYRILTDNGQVVSTGKLIVK